LDRVANIVDLIADIGEPCWATGLTAAGLHGFDGVPLRPPYHVVVMRGRNVRRIGHVVHTTVALDPIDREETMGVPCVSPTRALLAVSATLDSAALTCVLDGALRDGLTTEDFVHRRIGALRTKGRHGIPRLLDVIDGREVVRGGQSWLEREFLRLVHEAGLPVPLAQQSVSRQRQRLIRVDFRWPGTPVVVEALGYRWHRTGAQMSADAARMNRLLLDGFLPFQFTYRQVVADPPMVVETVASALRPFLGRVFDRSA